MIQEKSLIAQNFSPFLTMRAIKYVKYVNYGLVLQGKPILQGQFIGHDIHSKKKTFTGVEEYLFYVFLPYFSPCFELWKEN